ncbi:hypothetical protein MPSEU_000769300 [Mayamaea pseudoterrestris]|nr:hypothetical protein MPSEU_000769300 [Mayamaea pseudoterrestris]
MRASERMSCVNSILHNRSTRAIMASKTGRVPFEPFESQDALEAALKELGMLDGAILIMRRNCQELMFDVAEANKTPPRSLILEPSCHRPGVEKFDNVLVSAIFPYGQGPNKYYFFAAWNIEFTCRDYCLRQFHQLHVYPAVLSCSSDSDDTSAPYSVMMSESQDSLDSGYRGLHYVIPPGKKDYSRGYIAAMNAYNRAI